MNKVNQLFTAAWEKTEQTLEFNPAWADKLGHYDYAVYGEHAPKLANGTMVRSSTRGGRRMLIIGTRLGNMIVYDRFTKQARGEKDADKAVFYYNVPSAIAVGAWFGPTYLDEHDMAIAVGDQYESHIGWRVNQLWSAFKDTLTEAA